MIKEILKKFFIILLLTINFTAAFWFSFYQKYINWWNNIDNTELKIALVQTIVFNCQYSDNNLEICDIISKEETHVEPLKNKFIDRQLSSFSLTDIKFVMYFYNVKDLILKSKEKFDLDNLFEIYELQEIENLLIDGINVKSLRGIKRLNNLSRLEISQLCLPNLYPLFSSPKLRVLKVHESEINQNNCCPSNLENILKLEKKNILVTKNLNKNICNE